MPADTDKAGAARDPYEWAHWVVYFNPSDYPGRYVVRRVRMIYGTSGVEAVNDPEPAGVVESLEAARALIPPELYCLPRFVEDDPVIFEVWI